MKPNISIEQFNYHLPIEQIAKYPLPNREDSKLLVYKDNIITEDGFKNITSYLPSNSMLVFNNTKVIRARLWFKKLTGAQIEIFCLEPAYNTDVQMAFTQKGTSTWICIVGNLKKWKQGKIATAVTIDNKTIEIDAERIATQEESHTIRFSWNDDSLTFGELIDSMGTIPIPPYLNRESEALDGERYQTVYSEHKGSVAAPTAGLHFTSAILNEIKNKNIPIANITLHVGAGTFKPVKSSTIDEHQMHVEHFIVSRQTINQLINHEGCLIAVGTTTTRTLESLFWLGYKLSLGVSDLMIEQWDAYTYQPNINFKQALQHIINHLNTANCDHLPASTGIMIAPGYQFRAIDGLITNFHQPKSTLLLLLAALIGDNWKQLYDYALTHNFRFLSYGDSSIILNSKQQYNVV